MASELSLGSQLKREEKEFSFHPVTDHNNKELIVSTTTNVDCSLSYDRSMSFKVENEPELFVPDEDRSYSCATDSKGNEECLADLRREIKKEGDIHIHTGIQESKLKSRNEMNSIKKSYDSASSYDPSLEVKTEPEFYESNEYRRYSNPADLTAFFKKETKNVGNVNSSMDIQERHTKTHGEIQFIEKPSSDIINRDVVGYNTAKPADDSSFISDPNNEVKTEQEKFYESVDKDSAVGVKESTIGRNEVSEEEKNHSKKLFKCGECDKVFPHKIYLSSHMTMHNKEKLFRCKECNRSFSSMASLNGHRRIHMQEKPFECTDCGTAFSQSILLQTHIMRIHRVEKSFKCNDCEKTFSKKELLTKHVRIHTGEKPFECSDCGKAFSQKHHLTAHMKMHTGEKPFECNLCGKAFAQKHHLTSHRKTHTRVVERN